MDVFQCPECELKFRTANELRDHLTLDHPEFRADSKSVEDAMLAEAHRHRHARRGPRGDQP